MHCRVRLIRNTILSTDCWILVAPWTIASIVCVIGTRTMRETLPISKFDSSINNETFVVWTTTVTQMMIGSVVSVRKCHDWNVMWVIRFFSRTITSPFRRRRRPQQNKSGQLRWSSRRTTPTRLWPTTIQASARHTTMLPRTTIDGHRRHHRYKPSQSPTADRV